MAAADCKVLVIDCDPQANSTSGLGFEFDPDRKSLYSLLIDEVPVQDVSIERRRKASF